MTIAIALYCPWVPVGKSVDNNAAVIRICRY